MDYYNYNGLSNVSLHSPSYLLLPNFVVTLLTAYAINPILFSHKNFNLHCKKNTPKPYTVCACLFLSMNKTLKPFYLMFKRLLA